MTPITMLNERARWRSREVRYYAGDWQSILTLLPEFEFRPFNVGDGVPANPFLQVVVRMPLSAVERPIPVGIVSNTYSLAPHRQVAEEMGSEWISGQAQLLSAENNDLTPLPVPVPVAACPDRVSRRSILALVQIGWIGECCSLTKARSQSVAKPPTSAAFRVAMNDAAAAIALGRRIDLTHEGDFVIGDVHVEPTACEVTAGGQRIRVQPRVMQVLIALARAEGQPVSRDALIEVCWGSVAVGEDALNRCIQRLRGLARNDAGGAFRIETIPRIGYRLTAHPRFEGSANTVGPDRAPLDKPSVVVAPFATFSGDRDRDNIAQGVTEEIVRALSRVRTFFVIAGDARLSLDAANGVGARYLLQGSVQKAAGRVRVAVKLTDTKSGLQLWTDRFEGLQDEAFGLQDRVALAVTGAVEPAIAYTSTGYVLT